MQTLWANSCLALWPTPEFPFHIYLLSITVTVGAWDSSGNQTAHEGFVALMPPLLADAEGAGTISVREAPAPPSDTPRDTVEGRGAWGSLSVPRPSRAPEQGENTLDGEWKPLGRAASPIPLQA